MSEEAGASGAPPLRVAEPVQPGARRRLAVFSGGFLRDARLRRILALAGWQVQIGILPGQTVAVGVWGRRPVARRGLGAAKRAGLPVLTVEDAFLRSLRAGAEGDAPIGLLLDGRGPHFDAAAPSDLEVMLATHPLDDPALIARARDGIAFLQAERLSKVNTALAPAGALPEPGFVLVVDQTRGDAAIAYARASAATFETMLATARAENPGRLIFVLPHPEVAAGRRQGHLTGYGGQDGIFTLRGDFCPGDVLAAAARVYVVSSQMGFEAILYGHRPRVFGLPFYAGWGLSEDAQVCPRRGRRLTPEQLFAAAMLLYPVWYDPHLDRLTDFETAARCLAAEARHWRRSARPAQCVGLKPWKHRPVTPFLAGAGGRPRFVADGNRAVAAAAATGGRVVVWAGKETPALAEAAAAAGVPLERLEDGFLRSIGLGATLMPPWSLILDDLGIYFDPTRPSRLEALIAQASRLGPRALARAAALRKAIIAAGATKYNLGAPPPAIPRRPGQPVILVPGQVEDDASIRLGSGAVNTNLGLLAAVRARNPDALILYKPHPDVVAGLRPGAVPETAALALADRVLTGVEPAALIARVDAVWTMTSLLGFEALVRGRPVHCFGLPFYAGWGLTTDHGPACPRRTARPSLDALIHAALIDYPIYLDPVSLRPCPPETIVARLADPPPAMRRNPRRRFRVLSRLQQRLARFAPLWRGG